MALAFKRSAPICRTWSSGLAARGSWATHSRPATPGSVDQPYAVGITDDGGIALQAPGGGDRGFGRHERAARHSAKGSRLEPLTTDTNRSYERGSADTDNNWANFVLRSPSTHGAVLQAARPRHPLQRRRRSRLPRRPPRSTTEMPSCSARPSLRAAIRPAPGSHVHRGPLEHRRRGDASNWSTTARTATRPQATWCSLASVTVARMRRLRAPRRFGAACRRRPEPDRLRLRHPRRERADGASDAADGRPELRTIRQAQHRARLCVRRSWRQSHQHRPAGCDGPHPLGGGAATEFPNTAVRCAIRTPAIRHSPPVSNCPRRFRQGHRPDGCRVRR